VRRVCGVLLLLTLAFHLPAPIAHAVCGDVNGDGLQTATDALAVLQSAVGRPVELVCSCDDCIPESTTTTTTTTSSTTTTTMAAVFVGAVTNDVDPLLPGSGVGSPWSYGGALGVAAGNDMCVAVGADHVCTYAEVATAEAAGELDPLPNGLTFWIHRVSTEVLVDDSVSPPGPGGRCNDWTAGTDHLVDGEYAEKLTGAITYYFDADTAYDGVDPSHAQPGLPCGNVQRAILCCD